MKENKKKIFAIVITLLMALSTAIIIFLKSCESHRKNICVEIKTNKYTLLVPISEVKILPNLKLNVTYKKKIIKFDMNSKNFISLKIFKVACEPEMKK